MSHFVPYPLLMDPYIAERQPPWSGTRLAKRYAKRAGPDGRIGESWELSDHPHGRSRIANGPHAGREFGGLMKEFPREICGLASAPARYPLLVKFIDAGEPLSVQVHPDDDRAKRDGDRGKTECWFIMDCEPGGEVILGLAPGTTPERLRAAALSGDMLGAIARRPIRPGSFVYLPAGTVHAILGGTLICEVQQSSDLTYRLWDWNREPKREMHIERAVEVSDYAAAAAAGPLGKAYISETEGMTGKTILAENPYFEVAYFRAEAGGEPIRREIVNEHGTIVSVLEGSARWAEPHRDEPTLEAGQTWYLPPGITRLDLNPIRGPLKLLGSRPTAY